MLPKHLWLRDRSREGSEERDRSHFKLTYCSLLTSPEFT